MTADCPNLGVAGSSAAMILHMLDSYPDSRVHEAHMGPIWGRQVTGEAHESCYLGRYFWSTRNDRIIECKYILMFLIISSARQWSRREHSSWYRLLWISVHYNTTPRLIRRIFHNKLMRALQIKIRWLILGSSGCVYGTTLHINICHDDDSLHIDQAVAAINAF